MAVVIARGLVTQIAEAPEEHLATCKCEITSVPRKKTLPAYTQIMVVVSPEIEEAKKEFLAENADLFEASKRLQHLGFSNGQIDKISETKKYHPIWF